ncbi:hypothetical protein E2C01_009424 [Portunus trituberculatus]|uniref:Uncharacterized protein n=1 Tax=Portunus trituberculatus TaxID=210409 RepID=A0A5B7D527_PORTR|nr:hypothetical protein [Portunus trituberculatus]
MHSQERRHAGVGGSPYLHADIILRNRHTPSSMSSPHPPFPPVVGGDAVSCPTTASQSSPQLSHRQDNAIDLIETCFMGEGAATAIPTLISHPRQWLSVPRGPVWLT